MEHMVKGYLILLTLSGVVMLGFLALRMSKKRSLDGALNRPLFLREGFHILVGITLLALFSKGLMGVMTTLAASALLLIGFEYALTIFRRRASARSHFNPHG